MKIQPRPVDVLLSLLLSLELIEAHDHRFALTDLSATYFADSFADAMDSRGSILAQRLAERFNFSQHTALLDIAGGSGIYACSIARMNSHLAATVLEIPPVDLAATLSIESKGMSSHAFSPPPESAGLNRDFALSISASMQFTVKGLLGV
jgi:hypothetical protein